MGSKLAPNRGADLHHQPDRRQAIEPRHQRIVQGRRDGEGRQCPVEHISVAFLAQQAALDDALGQFLDKQRHPVGAIGDLGDDIVGQRLAANDLRDQGGAVTPVQPIERQHRHLRLASPGRLELGAECDEQ